MLLKKAFLIFSLLPACLSFQSVPVIVASHKLVKGLKNEINDSNATPHNVSSVTNLIKKLVTECSSDEYLIIDQPGLSYDDLTMKHKDEWPSLRKYLTLSSSVIGLPWVRDPPDLDFIEKYIIKNCQAETINVLHDDDSEVGHYIDVRPRVIKVHLSELPEDKTQRYQVIREHDELIRKILRKLPSPHYSIILTSTVPKPGHPVPTSIVSSYPDTYELFNDIINDPSRALEYERNDRFHRADPDWIKNKNPINRYLENKKKDEIHLFNYDLWTKNEKLITTIIVMVLSIFLMKFFLFLSYLKAKLSSRRTIEGIITHEKSD